ncbi:MAG: flagellar biosynthesis protein FliQ [Petroclostridium sp.]|jgi:flagellar biosynthetic protein FliQ|uniref:flagellar biosynthesis protein FliQ n=1 Tax=Petroclostridium xylanilyticum TaxID=1792311 RepID=UPI000B997807|nr:flagellar biosynthesis protein FliQ [Petroclostridium xylanilyticum]MBZ4645875.1 flagellar biosynthetic protein FliQ [Clostridia bacterium]MDK2809325.1 flagellar biosynthesis protein FliQ [Petroclostridium sp.]
MDQGLVIDLAQNALFTVLLIAGPMLGLGLLVGLAVSIFQAVTQIQEQTLAFIPKIIVVLGCIIIFGPWMLSVAVEFTQNLFLNMNNYLK